MAESVDALVSNTSNFTVVPVRPRLWVQRLFHKNSLFLFHQNFQAVFENFIKRIDTKTIKFLKFNS